ncbi:MAG: hypothetical protein SXV54_20120, partial [Chloroflexota bacterium]|nr:hypothetical protein [Chloroflexota bacterium]
ERAFPGYTLIQRHLGISRGTISRYNQLLKLCGLIHIEPGTQTRPNYYYILDIPEVTPERLAELRKRIAQVRDRPFVRTVLRRIEEWLPIEAHWKARRVGGQGKVIVRRSEVGEGGSPVEHPGPVVEHPGSPVEQGVPPGNWNDPKGTIQKNNPKGQSEATAAPTSEEKSAASAAVQALLQGFGVAEPALSELVARQLPPPTVQAWIMYIATQPALAEDGRGAGYLINRLRVGDDPPEQYRQLAVQILELDERQRRALRVAAQYAMRMGGWYYCDEADSLPDALLDVLETVTDKRSLSWLAEFGNQG